MTCPQVPPSDAPISRSWQEHARGTLRALDEAIDAFPREATQLLQAVEAGLVLLRDSFLIRLRSRSTAESQRLRQSLDVVNTCLSLVLGVEYPQGRQHLEPLQMARALLSGILDRSTEQDLGPPISVKPRR